MTQGPAGDAPGISSAAPRLGDRPGWLYLLREFDALYRHGSAAAAA